MHLLIGKLEHVRQVVRGSTGIAEDIPDVVLSDAETVVLTAGIAIDRLDTLHNPLAFSASY